MYNKYCIASTRRFERRSMMDKLRADLKQLAADQMI